MTGSNNQQQAVAMSINLFDLKRVVKDMKGEEREERKEKAIRGEKKKLQRG